MFGGLLPFAIPLLHIVGAPAAIVGKARGPAEEAAHLETAAGRARRKAALESMIAMPSPGQTEYDNGRRAQVESEMCPCSSITVSRKHSLLGWD